MRKAFRRNTYFLRYLDLGDWIDLILTILQASCILAWIIIGWVIVYWTFEVNNLWGVIVTFIMVAINQAIGRKNIKS